MIDVAYLNLPCGMNGGGSLGLYFGVHGCRLFKIDRLLYN